MVTLTPRGMIAAIYRRRFVILGQCISLSTAFSAALVTVWMISQM